MRRILITCLILMGSMHSSARTIDAIIFEGLTITKESYLRKLISLNEGDEADEERVKQDVFLLRNLNLFFSVDGEINDLNPEKILVIFKIREANYLYPIISVSGFKGQLKGQVGANHINFLGKAQSFGGLYQYYDRHSFSLFHSSRRHSNNKTGHAFALAKYSTIEPLYFPASENSSVDTTSYFDFDNYSASVVGFYWLKQFLHIEVGGAAMYEDYHQRDEAFITYTQDDFSFFKHQVQTSIEHAKLENLYERKAGLSGRVYGEWIHTYTDNAPSFLKLLLDGSWQTFTGKRGNLATHMRFGISTNNYSPFSPFVLDGFQNVRGIGNRVERGTAELIVNAEYRYSFLKHKYVTLQAAGFVDYGSLRSAGDKFDQFFEKSENNIFTGVGIRVHLNVLYKTCVRVDYSVSPANPSQQGFTFGFGQFF